jgi:hypothetical protein
MTITMNGNTQRLTAVQHGRELGRSRGPQRLRAGARPDGQERGQAPGPTARSGAWVCGRLPGW